MSGTRKSPSRTEPRGSDWLKEATRRAAVTKVKTGPRHAIPATVPEAPKKKSHVEERKRLRDKIAAVVAAAAAENSAAVARGRPAR